MAGKTGNEKRLTSLATRELQTATGYGMHTVPVVDSALPSGVTTSHYEVRFVLEPFSMVSFPPELILIELLGWTVEMCLVAAGCLVDREL